MLARIAPQRIERCVVWIKAGIHRQQLDSSETELLVAVAHLLFPAGLRWINGEKSDKSVWMRIDISGDVGVVYPHARQVGLAAKDDGLVGRLCPCAIGVVGDA